MKKWWTAPYGDQQQKVTLVSQVTLENCEILAFLGLNRHLKEAKGNSLFKVVT